MQNQFYLIAGISFVILSGQVLGAFTFQECANLTGDSGKKETNDKFLNTLTITTKVLGYCYNILEPTNDPETLQSFVEETENFCKNQDSLDKGITDSMLFNFKIKEKHFILGTLFVSSENSGVLFITLEMPENDVMHRAV